jgi:hypothetical protein
MVTGLAKVRVSQPLADSLVKVPVARTWPVLLQSVPVCVPVLEAFL